MKKLLQILVGALAISLIGAGLVSLPGTSHAVKANQPDAVIVTNTPLPVQGLNGYFVNQCVARFFKGNA